jgi:hypothetical protein
MECSRCRQHITSGMAIGLPGGQRQVASSHCPYCLERLPSKSEVAQVDASEVNLERHEKRRETRAEFVDQLIAQASDGKLHCPVCNHGLNKSDELILRNSEYFKCPHCCHDLASVAYRREAYREERWLPLVSALVDLKSEKECPGCCYFGAIAKACQSAFSWMPHIKPEPVNQVSAMLRRSNWRLPKCDVASCVAVKNYRHLAGDVLLML